MGPIVNMKNFFKQKTFEIQEMEVFSEMPLSDQKQQLLGNEVAINYLFREGLFPEGRKRLNLP